MDFQSCDFNLSQENDVWIWIIISCCWKKNWKNGRNHQPHFKCFQVHLLLKSQLFDKHFTCAVALNIADLGSNNWGDWGLCRAQTITIATTCYHLDHWLKMYQMLVLQPSLIVNFMLRLEYLWVSWSLGGCKFQKKNSATAAAILSSSSKSAWYLPTRWEDLRAAMTGYRWESLPPCGSLSGEFHMLLAAISVIS